MKCKIFNVALYIRLSREDGDNMESESITNQRELLQMFLEKTKEKLIYIDEYVDDGISGSTFDMYSTVSGLVLYELTSDETIATITVTAEDGSTKVYTVRIVKEAKPVVTTSNISYVYSSNNYLKTLEIADYDIDFDRLVNEYRIRVDSDVNSLDIKAIAEDNRASVEITGNENFKTGDNIVIIKVTAENGDVNEYKLIVNKKAPKKNAVTVTDDSSNTAEKVVIIVLIVLVVLGLLYLIFKKDDEDEVPVQKDDKSKNKK